MGLVISTALASIGVVSLIFGIMVLAYGKRSPSKFWFFGAISSNGLWAIGLSLFLSLSPVDGWDLLGVVKFYYIAALMISMTMLALVLSLGRKKIPALASIAILLPGVLMSLAIVFVPQLMIGEISYNGLQHIVVLREGYIVYSALFLIYYLLTMVAIVIRRSKESGSSELCAQLASILYAYGLAGTLGLIFDLILPGMGNYTLIWIGPLGTIAFIPIIYRAIVLQGLFDIRAALSRVIAYTLTLAILAVVYVLLAYTISIILFNDRVTGGVEASLVSIGLALVLALIFQPIKHFFDQLTNKIFFRGVYNRDVFFREFGRILSYDTDLMLLLRQVSSYLATTLGAEQAYFYIINRGIHRGVGPRKTCLPEEDIKKIYEYYQQNHDSPEVIVLELVKQQNMKRLLSSHQIQIVVPLILQGEAIGYLFLGDHKSRGYTNRDVQVLESIANELAIAIQNSLSVEEIRDLNENLQKKVDDATRELRTSNRQLQRLDEAKNEFISMASHQLRTPLTSIKGYLDMILEGDLGKVSTTQRAVLSEAFVSSERMVTLINDFLNISRLQTGKFTIERRKNDLAEALNSQVKMLEMLADHHNIKLDVKIDKNIPPLNIDIDKIRQVILNMLDNAIYYSKPGTSAKIRLQLEGNQVIFTVKDTGIGVPKSEQSGLFSKFFRASNARKERPDGTGVGLFLAKKVVMAHGGEIIFESSEGKGSTFGFKIPFKA